MPEVTDLKGFHITAADNAKLTSLAKQTGRSRSGMIRQLIRQAKLSGVSDIIFVESEVVSAGDANEHASVS
jgi:predicted DNA-binding protein